VNAGQRPGNWGKVAFYPQTLPSGASVPTNRKSDYEIAGQGDQGSASRSRGIIGVAQGFISIGFPAVPKTKARRVRQAFENGGRD